MFSPYITFAAYCSKDVLVYITLCISMHYISENDACSHYTGCLAEAVAPQSGLSMSSKDIPFWSTLIQFL